jgi:hypothetical protein
MEQVFELLEMKPQAKMDMEGITKEVIQSLKNRNRYATRMWGLHCR